MNASTPPLTTLRATFFVVLAFAVPAPDFLLATRLYLAERSDQPATFSTVAHVRVVTSTPNVFSIKPMKAPPFGLGM